MQFVPIANAVTPCAVPAVPSTDHGGGKRRAYRAAPGVAVGALFRFRGCGAAGQGKRLLGGFPCSPCASPYPFLGEQ